MILNVVLAFVYRMLQGKFYYFKAVPFCFACDSRICHQTSEIVNACPWDNLVRV